MQQHGPVGGLLLPVSVTGRPWRSWACVPAGSAGMTALQASGGRKLDRVRSVRRFRWPLLGVACDGWAAGGSARARTGGSSNWRTRVLTAGRRPDRAVACVRAADPAGRQAMAAVWLPAGSEPVLAVDSTRLAAVADWRADYRRSPR